MVTIPAPPGSTALVPCCHVGLGTGEVAVTDAKVRLPVWLVRRDLALGPGGVVCVRAAVVETDPALLLALVELPNRKRVWVRPLPDRGGGGIGFWGPEIARDVPRKADGGHEPSTVGG